MWDVNSLQHLNSDPRLHDVPMVGFVNPKELGSFVGLPRNHRCCVHSPCATTGMIRKVATNVGIAIIHHPPFITIFMGVNHQFDGWFTIFMGGINHQKLRWFMTLLGPHITHLFTRLMSRKGWNCSPGAVLSWACWWKKNSKTWYMYICMYIYIWINPSK